jgi:micrococcal nuclease
VTGQPCGQRHDLVRQHTVPVTVELHPDEMDCTELGERAGQEFAKAALVSSGGFVLRSFYRAFGRALPLAALLGTLVLAGCTRSDPTTAFPDEPPTTATIPATSSAACARAPDDTCAAWVVRVVDGDTLAARLVDGKTETVRLVGVDTPETHHPTKPVQCYGPEAAAATARLVPPGTRLVLVVGHQPRDRYGRLLAYVYAPDRLPGGRMLNAELLHSGYARVLPIRPNTLHAKGFAELEADAKAHRWGLWGACPAPTTTMKGPP